MPIFIQINDIDNVAVALHPAPAGTAFGGVAALEDIAGGLGRDLAAVQAELNRLDALERRSMGREALR